MISIVPYDPAHRALLVLRVAQRGDAARFRFAADGAEHGPAFTAAEFGEDGAIVRVLACAGLAENSPDYATAWAMFAEDLRPREWAALAAAIRGVFEAASYDRIDMVVRAGFDAAERFARHLGFAPDAAIWAHVSRGTIGTGPRPSPGNECEREAA